MSAFSLTALIPSMCAGPVSAAGRAAYNVKILFVEKHIQQVNLPERGAACEKDFAPLSWMVRIFLIYLHSCGTY